MTEEAPITFELLDRGDDRWTAFLRQHDVTLFQGGRWSEAIARGYELPVRVLVAFEGSRVVGGLPYAEISDFRGHRRIALPFTDYCEPVGLPLAKFEATMLSAGVPWKLRSRAVPGASASGVEVVAAHHYATLPRAREDLARQFHAKHKQNVKQAQSAGLVYERRTLQDGLDAFYTLHTQVRREKHRRLPQGRSVFETIADIYGDDGFVAIAAHAGRPVAGMLFLREGKSLYYVFSASAGDALLMRPNHFLMTRVMEQAVDEGIEGIDLGISTGEGLVRFKQRVGGVESAVYRATYGELVVTPEAQALEERLRELTVLLTEPDVPVGVTQKAGALLYRYFVY